MTSNLFKRISDKVRRCKRAMYEWVMRFTSYDLIRRATEDIKFLFREEKFAAEASRNVPKFPYEMREKNLLGQDFEIEFNLPEQSELWESILAFKSLRKLLVWIFQKTKTIWPEHDESCITALPRTICSTEGGHKRFPSGIKLTPIRTYLSFFCEWFISRAYFFILLEALFGNIEGFSLIELRARKRFRHRP